MTDREKVIEWLKSIKATPEEIECAIEQCKANKDDRVYFLSMADRETTKQRSRGFSDGKTKSSGD